MANALTPITPLKYPLKMFTDIKCDYMQFDIKKYQMVSSRTSNSIYRTSDLTGKIFTYMAPNQITSHNVQWGETDLGLLKIVQSLDTSGGVGDFLKSAASKAGDAGQIIASRAISNIFGGKFGKAVGTIYNARLEQLFKGVDFRKFSFDFVFAPESQKEAEEILKIIRTFKLAMHPKKLTYKEVTAEYLFEFPNIFNIKFMTAENNENAAMDKIADCGLVNMTINRTPNHEWSAIRKLAEEVADASYPTQINLTLDFIELDQLTAELISENGF